ncbi:hypothetical protein OY671_011045 [Metschnikowia pulcherrima]|nr:hypothetical protein OY671_011045 [Metschnikowia pulcherrima]
MHPISDSANASHRDDVFALWDQSAEFSAGEADDASTHLLSTLCAMVTAQNALCAVVVRLPSVARKDPLFG